MNNETKHTPGPWMSIGPAIFQNHSPVAYLNDEQISRIATIQHFDDGYDPNDLLSPDSKKVSEARANTRLIASAPDLLIALMDLQKIAGRISDLTSLGQVGNPQDWRWLAVSAEQARAAITKATEGDK